MESAPQPKINLKALTPLFFLPVLWLGTSVTALVFLSTLRTPQQAYLTYSAKPMVLAESTSRMESSDARVQKIRSVYTRFNCPLLGKEEFIVKKADEFGIPYWLVAAVSFQESSCGKNTPKPEGVGESYNAWGYGVWGTHVKTFDSWEAGITAVSKYFGTNFFSKGVTDPCEIMETYTPPSRGSWCNGVKYFAQLIEETGL